MRHSDQLTFVNGKLRLCVVDRDGAVLLDETAHNLVVSGGRCAAARALAGVAAAIPAVVAVGTSDAAPAHSDTAITDAVNIPISNYTINENAVTFHFNIGYFDADGVRIVELGLLTQDGTLFSRFTRAPIEKTNHIAVRGEWTITFS